MSKLLVFLIGVIVLIWYLFTRPNPDEDALTSQGTVPAQTPERFGIGGVALQPGYNFDWFNRNTWNEQPFGIGGGWNAYDDSGVPAAPKALEDPSFGVGGGAIGSELLDGDPFGEWL